MPPLLLLACRHCCWLLGPVAQPRARPSLPAPRPDRLPPAPPPPSTRPPRQVLPKREGLLHVSEWGPARVANIADEVKEGDLVDVMIIEVQVRAG